MKKFLLNPVSFLLIFFLLFLFQCSSGSTLIRESCMEASKGDPKISYTFCVAYLEAMVKTELNSLENLTGISIQLAKFNATNVGSHILKLLKDQEFSPYARACLKDCHDLYSDAVTELEDAMCAFKNKDLDTACINVGAALDASSTCEDQFKHKGETSPLTKDNNCYSQLVTISLAFIQMYRHRQRA